MTPPASTRARRGVVAAYYAVAIAFFAYLLNYYLTTLGGPTLLAFTMVPVTFVLFTLDGLRKGGLYPRLGFGLNAAIIAVYTAVCAAISLYLLTEFEALGTVRAGVWNTADLLAGGAMFILVMEYARLKHFELFILNLVAILYAVYGWMVPGMFYHPGLSWTRIITSMSLEDSTGVFSSLPQLALTLIGSFILVLSALQAFGCIDSILKGAAQIARRSPHALPQAAVLGSMGVAAVSGSGAANAVTTGSATIPALIGAGLPRADAAAVETSASLGGQLMPPVMGISAFLMADFLGRSYFDVVVRGYAPALIYFAGVAVGVYLLTARIGTLRFSGRVEAMAWPDWINFGAFLAVVAGLVLLMAVGRVPELFAAIYVFFAVFTVLLLRAALMAARRAGGFDWRAVGRQLLAFVDTYALMTAELTLLLAMLGILTSAFVNTGVPTKVGFLLVDAAGVNVALMALVAFVFGALLGLGLPPAPTYILTAIVIAPHMIKAGLNPWPVHFYVFFLAVWGELTPPTSIVAAVTSKIAQASFSATLGRGILLCASLFVLMVAMFTRPELVIEPGVAQLGAFFFVLVATVGVMFAIQARFSRAWYVDWSARAAIGACALVILFVRNPPFALLGCAGVALLAGYWLWRERRAAPAAASPAAKVGTETW
jgi:TRAP transporter 4TM/12TM fusion protein